MWFNCFEEQGCCWLLHGLGVFVAVAYLSATSSNFRLRFFSTLFNYVKAASFKFLPARLCTDDSFYYVDLLIDKSDISHKRKRKKQNRMKKHHHSSNLTLIEPPSKYHIYCRNQCWEQ